MAPRWADSGHFLSSGTIVVPSPSSQPNLGKKESWEALFSLVTGNTCHVPTTFYIYFHSVLYYS